MKWPYHKIKCYPTMVDHNFNITFPNKSKEEANNRVYNSNGREVLFIRQKVGLGGKIDIDVSDFNKGIYFYTIVTNGLDAAQKFIKK